MGLFYDPIQKKTKPWVFIVFVVMPIVLIVLFFIFASPYAKKKSVAERELTPQEFFQKFNKTNQ